MAAYPCDHRLVPLFAKTLQVSGVLLLSSSLAVSQAAFTTAIQSDGTMGTTVAPPVGNVYNINGGTIINGTNQFHSFDVFSVGTGDIASFNGPSGIVNILSRVTGLQSGLQQSMIDGTLRSTITGANLYLLNPAGVLFGPHATLDVSGSFHVSTADYLRLTDNVQFLAHPDPVVDALLTSAAPAAFGFLNPNPAAGITVQGSLLSVPAGQTISLVGGNITIQAGTLDDGTAQASRLSAPNGQINLATSASPGEFLVPGLQSNPNVNGDSFTAYGTITLAPGSAIAVSGSGTVAIRGGQFVLEITNSSLSTAVDPPSADTVTLSNGSSIVTAAFGSDPGADVEITTGTLTLDGASTFIKTLSSGEGGGGNVTANVSTLTLKNGAEVFSNNSNFGFGPGGNLTVYGLGGAGTSADSVVITGSGSGMFSFNDSGGNGGGVTINARNLTMDAGGQIMTTTLGNLGDGLGGDIVVNTQFLNGSNGAFIKSETQSFAFFGPGQGGNVTVTATDSAGFSGPNSGIFSASVFGLAPPGGITVNAKNFTLTDGAVVQSGSPFDFSGGGQVTVQGPGGAGTRADSVVISNGSSISNQALISDAGQVGITAKTLTINNGSINTSTLEFGRGGDIVLDVWNLNLGNSAVLSSQSLNVGNAGDIRITAIDSIVSRDSTITTQANLADGGNIFLKAGQLVHLTNTAVTSAVGNETITTTQGGNIIIDPEFVVLQNSQILANAFAGTGGNITITTGVFLADPGSVLDASSQLGISGEINIQAPVQNIGGRLAPLPRQFSSAVGLLAQQCAARAANGKFSTFVVAGREGLPAEPGGFLPSPSLTAGLVGSAVSGRYPQAQGSTFVGSFPEDDTRPIRLAKSEYKCGQ